MHPFYPGLLLTAAAIVIGIAFVRSPADVERRQRRIRRSLFGVEPRRSPEARSSVIRLVGFFSIGPGVFIAIVSLTNGQFP